MRIPFLSRGMPNMVQNVARYKLTQDGQSMAERAGGGIVSGLDMDVLIILMMAGGSGTIGEVSKELGRSPQFTKNILESLRGRGYVIISETR